MSKWMQKLNKMEGAVDKEYDFFATENVLRCTSPSVNWIFGKGSGLPYGFSAIFYGEPKSGKSLLANLFTGGLHASDPDAIAMKFNTEMREAGQMEDYWGVDPDRYIAYDVNEPALIFDRLKDDILPMVQDGMPLKLIIIDSLTGIQGIKESNRESITQHLIGDAALTIGSGLKLILPILRRHKISLICTTHVRGNFDGGPYGPKTKMAGGFFQKHFAEYFVEVKRDGSSASKIEVDTKDFRGKKEVTGHKIYVKMAESSVGVAGRSGQFTLSYDQGLTNVEEELVILAKNLGLVEMPNNRTYIVGDKKYTSKADFTRALRDDLDLQKELIGKIYSSNVR